MSDTHGCWDYSYLDFFSSCDEVWHAGDIGSVGIIERFESFRPFRAVYGNIDSADVRARTRETLRFTIEGMTVMIKHIGGYPGHYDRSVAGLLAADPPQIFISGHSHILRVMYDKRLGILHVNPGAAGQYGLHKVRTLVRFTIDDGKAADLEVMELPRRAVGY